MTVTRKSRVEVRGATFGRMAKREPGLTGRRTKTGLMHLTVVLDPKHVAALRSEAFRRAAETESRKPDASEVLREILDAWIAKGRAKG